ncbi:hypothetical protein KAU11_11350, partial [Candidatus Babeliales bacterium]|nr:hypothetical protein [Candidatus Babeliales bacterium]
FLEGEGAGFSLNPNIINNDALINRIVLLDDTISLRKLEAMSLEELLKLEEKLKKSKSGIKAILEGSVAAQEAVIKKLKDEQSRLATSTEAWDSYQEKIEEATARLKRFKGVTSLFTGLDGGRKSGLSEISIDKEDVEIFAPQGDNDKETDRIKRLLLMKQALKDVSETFADVFDIDMSKFDFLFDGLKNGIEDWADLSKELIGGVLDASMLRYEVELQEAIRTRDLILNNDLSTEEQKRAARDKFEEEEAKIKNARAKKDRENTLIKIAIDTAAGVAKVIAQTGVFSPALSIPIIALGLAQAAFVASQPLPKFADGTDNAPEGWAITQERGAEPILDKHGRLKTMGHSGGDSLTYLEQGDKVFSSKDALFSEFNSEDIDRAVFNMNMQSNGNILSKRHVDNSLLNETKGLRKDMDKMGRRIEKIASRPINNNVTVEMPDNTAY